MEQEKLNQIVELVEEGCFIDGGHHKQWYLYQIAKILHNDNLLNIDLNDVDEGVSP